MFIETVFTEVCNVHTMVRWVFIAATRVLIFITIMTPRAPTQQLEVLVTHDKTMTDD